MTLIYKVVQTHAGESIAHLEVPESAKVLSPPAADDSRVRVERATTQFIENYEPMGWGPVEERTTYTVGEVTEAREFNTNLELVSGAGLHGFRERDDAVDWMEQADI